MTRRNRLIAVLAVLTMLGSVAIAGAEEPVVEPATEKLYIAAGCPEDTPGTCTSTRWLGKTPGDATSNFVTSVTPVDEVLFRAEGSLNWRDYVSDDSLRTAGYPLRADAPLTQVVTVSSEEGAAVNMTVHARIDGFTATGQDVTFGPLEQTFNMLPTSTNAVKFEFDIPAELDGVVLQSLTAWVAVHGVNVQAGHINQEGGSTVEIPYWVPVEIPVP